LPKKLEENCHLTIGDEMTSLFLSARATGAAGLAAAWPTGSG